MIDLRPKHFALDDTGSALVEAGIAFPIILMLTFGVISFGWQIWLVTSLNIITGQAARCAAINADLCGSASATKQYAVASSSAAGMPFTIDNFPSVILSARCSGATWSSTSSASQKCAKVTSSYVFSFNIPFFGAQTAPLAFSAEYPTIN